MTNKIYNWTEFVPENLLNLDVGSDNYKFFQSIVDYGIKQYDGIEKEKQWISIDTAQGKALDKIGENYGEYRGEADDVFFRFMIKSKILSSRSKGTANEIINIIQKSLDVDIDKIIVKEKRVYDHISNQFNGDPFTISVEKLPLSFTVDAFQKRYLIKRIEDCAAEGIKLDNISFLDYGNAYAYIGSAISKRICKASLSSVLAK